MFAVHMFTGKHPMFDRALWRSFNLVAAIGFMLVIGVVMMATMTLLPPMMQTLYAYPVLDTGLLLMPRGIGVLNNIAFATLPPRYRTEGASLMNLSRNAGAPVGISIVTTLLARSTQTSHPDLAARVTPQALNTLDPSLLQMLGSTGDAEMAMLNVEVTRQALMIACLNDFWAMAIMTAISVPRS